MITPLWQNCVTELTHKLSEEEISKWIRPLQPTQEKNGTLRLFAPNQFVLDWVNKNCLDTIRKTLTRLNSADISPILEIGPPFSTPQKTKEKQYVTIQKPRAPQRLNSESTFDLFVEGKSNEMARAAAMQVATNPGATFNPLFIYGGVGLGKTHLMHAIGNEVIRRKPDATIAYLQTEHFVAEMVAAIKLGKINRFQEIYRSVDVLLIDDVHIFVGKKQSQEELFHTFNSLHENGQQIVLTSDRYPKDIEGLEERLKSRFGWGLAQAIEPPEFETRVAILESKAEQINCALPEDVAFFIAKQLRSNVRELEGALRRVSANAEFSGKEITVEFAKNALADMLAAHQRQTTIASIQKTVAEFYNLRLADMTSPRRNRSVVRPRQIAMALSKELTSHSLPEIGQEFGKRDHTTVIHACNKVAELKKEIPQIEKDYILLRRALQQ